MTGKKLSHTDSKGKASMVDVGQKEYQSRKAVATGFIKMQKETILLVEKNLVKKGDVLSIAEIAGIQAAKQTPILIPLCHNLNLTKIELQCSIATNGIKVQSEVRCNGQTGVEMEALTAVSVALLTIYDMCKAVDKKMSISEIKLLEKSKTNIT